MVEARHARMPLSTNEGHLGVFRIEFLHGWMRAREQAFAEAPAYPRGCSGGLKAAALNCWPRRTTRLHTVGTSDRQGTAQHSLVVYVIVLARLPATATG